MAGVPESHVDSGMMRFAGSPDRKRDPHLLTDVHGKKYRESIAFDVTVFAGLSDQESVPHLMTGVHKRTIAQCCTFGVTQLTGRGNPTC